MSGQALKSVVIVAGINSVQLYQEFHKYIFGGYNSLMNKFKVRLLKESNIKVTKTVLPHKFKESEYEELIRLRAEITYLRLKMKLKKLCDLRRKSCDYQNAPQ